MQTSIDIYIRKPPKRFRFKVEAPYSMCSALSGPNLVPSLHAL